MDTSLLLILLLALTSVSSFTTDPEALMPGVDEFVKQIQDTQMDMTEEELLNSTDFKVEGEEGKGRVGDLLKNATDSKMGDYNIYFCRNCKAMILFERYKTGGMRTTITSSTTRSPSEWPTMISRGRTRTWSEPTDTSP